MGAHDDLAAALRRLPPGTLDGLLSATWSQAETARVRPGPPDGLAQVWAAFALCAAAARDDQRDALRAADSAMDTWQIEERPGESTTDDDTPGGYHAG